MTADRREGLTIHGRYVLERRLGAGAFGEVWAAEDTTLARRVALKFTSPEKLAQLRQEAAALAQMRHEHVVMVYDVVPDADAPVLVMEYVEGESLRQRMERSSPLPVDEAVSVARAILSALEHAHGKGILHRDVKPENVLLGADGVVRLGDFGLGKLTETEISMLSMRSIQAKGADQSVAGTLAYMAPEQKRGQEDERSDLYAVGVLLYEMLTGRMPEGRFRDPSAHNAEVPEWLDAAIVRALDGDARERFASARAMHEALGSSRAPQLTQSAPPSAPEEQARMACEVALSDGLLTEPARAQLGSIARELGLSSEGATRIARQALARRKYDAGPAPPISKGTADSQSGPARAAESPGGTASGPPPSPRALAERSTPPPVPAAPRTRDAGGQRPEAQAGPPPRTPRPGTVVASAADVRRALRDLEATLRRSGASESVHNCGFQGGQEAMTVLTRGGVWTSVPEDCGDSSVIVCGLTRHAMAVTVQFRFSTSGFSLRRSGVLVRSAEGHRLLCHTGGIAGGRQGIGKTGFWKAYGGPVVIVAHPRDGSRLQLAVGCDLDGGSAAAELASFVREVDRVKSTLAGTAR